MQIDWINYFFAMKGRLGRLQYLLRSFGTLAFLLPTYLLTFTLKWDVMLFKIAFITIGFACIGACMLSQVSIGVRRLHDMGLTGKWYLTIFIPYVDFLLLFALIFMPSSDDNNPYDLNMDRFHRGKLQIDAFD